MSEFTYYLGTYRVNMTLGNTHKDNNGEEVTGEITLGQWVLRHVTSISESETSQSSTIGIPNKPSECAYVYDTSGPTRTFNISGVRYDNEEEISNLDFIHTQFNKNVQNSSYDPFTGEAHDQTITYNIGIEWLTSTLQSTMRGYEFRRISSELDESERVPVGDLGNSTYGETFNVGLTAFSYTLDSETPGKMDYTLTLVERVEYPSGIPYREYTPSVEYVSE